MIESKEHKRNGFNQCPECGGMVITIPERGEVVCEECGLVVDERSLDTAHNDKRAFTAQERKNRERTGSPISSLMPDIGMATVMDKRSIENPDLKRASKWDTRMSWKSRNLLMASTELKRIGTNLNLPNHVKELAFQNYKEAFKNQLLRGRSINAMVAASLYFAVRKKRVPITLEEILEETSSNPKDVKKSYYTLIKELGKKLPNRDPANMVSRYVSELGLDAEIETITRKILNKYKDVKATSGKDPKGLVAGAIYLACRLKNMIFTQKEIANAIGVTEVTLRSRFKDYVKTFNIKV